jgi:hypothetical protein
MHGMTRLSLTRLIPFKQATARGADARSCFINVRVVMLLQITEAIHHESRRKPKTVYDLTVVAQVEQFELSIPRV